MTDDEIKKFITSRQSKLESYRSTWESEWQECANYVIPLREDIYGINTPGQRKGKYIYDGTATGALMLFANGLHGYLISPALKWFKLQMSRTEINDIPEVTEWLQEVEFCMYAALDKSNWYDQAWAFLCDGGSIGTASMYAEEDLGNGRIIFETIHPGESYIAENRYGEVDVFHRKRKLTARQAVQKFGKEKLPEAIKNAYENNPFQEFEFIHAVYPREDYDTFKIDNKNKPFASIWYCTSGYKVIEISGYQEFPYMVWRYSKSGKEVYGRSPALLALSDIKGLNLMAKTMLGAAQMAVDPPLNIPSDLAGKIQWKPRGLNYYSDPSKVVHPATTGISFPIGVDREQAKQKIIEQHFQVDFFLMLARAEGTMTATEVMERQGEKAAVLGASIGRLQSEALNKAIDMVFRIENEAGRLPRVPDALLEYGGDAIDIVYMGTLAQAQRRLFKTQGIKQGLDAILPVLQISPEASDVPDWDETVRELLESSGFPQKLIKSKERVDALRQARQQAQAQENAINDAMSMAEGVKTASEADKNLGGALTSQLAGAMPFQSAQQTAGNPLGAVGG